jgi:hypothetical protein
MEKAKPPSKLTAALSSPVNFVHPAIVFFLLTQWVKNKSVFARAHPVQVPSLARGEGAA